MGAQPSGLDALSGRWRSDVVLKRDVFSTIERGRFRGPDGEVDAVLRRIDAVPWWSRPIARHFLDREARALDGAEHVPLEHHVTAPAPGKLGEARRLCPHCTTSWHQPPACPRVNGKMMRNHKR